ncbi:hypothetical protein Dimus_019064 [Dionaea muscipula]
MAEDHQYNQGGGGGGSWWDSSRAGHFDPAGSSSTSSSSSLTAAAGSYGWLTETVDITMRSSGVVVDSTSDSSSSVIFPADSHHKLNLQGANSTSTSTAAALQLVDPSLQIMGLALSYPTMDSWNHSLLRNEKGREESSYGNSLLQEGLGTSTNFNQEVHQWRNVNVEESSNFKQINSGILAVADQPTETHFNSLESASVYSTPASIFQGLIISDHHQQQPHEQQAPQHQMIDYAAYSTQQQQQQQTSYGLGFAGDDNLLPSWSSKAPQTFLRATNSPSPSSSSCSPAPAPKQVPAKLAPSSTHAQLQFTNSAPFWNASSAASVALLSDVGRPTSFFPTLLQQAQLPSPVPTFNQKEKVRGETVKISSSDHQATNKRSRNEASSTLPPFKVRKEKMGDRITALQQLVSPFGKTDTASVLSEAIEYIKFLHEQVNVLSTPYLKSGASLQPHQKNEKSKDQQDASKQDLRSRGLCLVPVSSTFPVAHETTVDFWTPTFGGTFR